MIIQLRYDSDVPLYLQIRNEILRGIATGALSLGEDLPTVRQLAQDAGINPMTVNKAYVLLKKEGYVQTDRRRGAKVASHMPQGKSLDEASLEALTLFLCEAKLAGMSEEGILELVSKRLSALV